MRNTPGVLPSENVWRLIALVLVAILFTCTSGIVVPSAGEIEAVEALMRVNPTLPFAGANASLACSGPEFQGFFGCNTNGSIILLCVWVV